jgi:hypothetical protein
MNRRDFLKFCAVGIAGFFLARLTRLFDFGEKSPSEPGLKEARFYQSSDDLAG